MSSKEIKEQVKKLGKAYLNDAGINAQRIQSSQNISKETLNKAEIAKLNSFKDNSFLNSFIVGLNEVKNMKNTEDNIIKDIVNDVLGTTDTKFEEYKVKKVNEYIINYPLPISSTDLVAFLQYIYFEITGPSKHDQSAWLTKKKQIIEYVYKNVKDKNTLSVVDELNNSFIKEEVKGSSFWATTYVISSFIIGIAIYFFTTNKIVFGIMALILMVLILSIIIKYRLKRTKTTFKYHCRILFKRIDKFMNKHDYLYLLFILLFIVIVFGGLSLILKLFN